VEGHGFLKIKNQSPKFKENSNAKIQWAHPDATAVPSRDGARRRRRLRPSGRNESGESCDSGGSVPSPDAPLGDRDSVARCSVFNVEGHGFLKIKNQSSKFKENSNAKIQWAHPDATAVPSRDGAPRRRRPRSCRWSFLPGQKPGAMTLRFQILSVKSRFRPQSPGTSPTHQNPKFET
jgi:hypothetical protein